MRKEVSRKISLLLMMLMVMMMVAGCGDKKTDSSKETATKEVSATGENNGESNGGTEEGNTEATDSDFDFNQVFDNIEVNGKHVPFPFTLNDLGDEYDIEYVNDLGDGIYGARLKYNRETISDVYYMADSKESINRDSEVYRIDFSRVDYKMMNIKGVGCGSSYDDVRESIVGLEERFEENKITFMEKRIDGNVISIFFEDDEKISSIYLIKGGK